LGLFDEEGLLHQVGHTSAFGAPEGRAMLEVLEALVEEPGFTGNAPGGPSRWSRGRENEWVPVRPKIVVEVRYDHASGGRFRHATKLLRLRPDKTPEQCAFEQIRRTGADALTLLRRGTRVPRGP